MAVYQWSVISFHQKQDLPKSTSIGGTIKASLRTLHWNVTSINKGNDLGDTVQALPQFLAPSKDVWQLQPLSSNGTAGDGASP